MKNRIPSLLTLIALIGSGCSGPTEPVAIATIQVTAPSTTLASGATVQLTAATLGKNGKALTDRVVTWSSSNQTIATVSATGLVTAGSVLGATAESVTITASAEGVTGTAALTVNPAPVTTVLYSPDSVTLQVGASAQLSVTLKDKAGSSLTGRTISYQSLDTLIARVSSTGTVTALSYLGPDLRTARIVATSEGVADTARIYVPPIPVGRVQINTDSLTLLPTDSTSLSIRFLSSTNQELVGRTAVVTSSDTAVVIVELSTRIIGRKQGIAYITATSGQAADTLAVDVVTWQMIAAGGEHTCAINSRAHLFCWGWNSDGQIGNGTQTDATQPIRVLGPSKYKSVAAGTYHTCAVSLSGDIECWGANSYGQIGDSSVTNRLQPATAKMTARAVSVSAGETHTCTLATDSTAFCWGNNTSGELGINTQTSSSTPKRVGFAAIPKWIAIEARNQHTCGLDTTGKALCWGLNSYASLGLGTDFSGIRTTPQAVATQTSFVRLMSRGHWHSCATTETGSTECWGLNWLGALGNPAAGYQTVTPFRVVGGINWSSVSGGGGHLVGGRNFSCGVSNQQKLYCWGDNTYGQGGVGFQSNLEPTLVPISTKAVEVVTGAGHTCFRSDEGQVFCAGRNDKGSLGNGTRTATSTFGRVRLVQ